MQSRSQSLLETIVRASSNYFTALLIQVAIFPLIFRDPRGRPIHLPLLENVGIGLIFFLNSVAGGFVWRRIFNGWDVYRNGKRADLRQREPVGVRVKRAIQRLHRIADGRY